jgi:hypothetical protein
VVEALGDVQHPVLGNPQLGQLGQGQAEVVGGRLVGAGVIGGDHGVEGGPEPGVAVVERGAVDVGDDHELVVPPEVGERRWAVGERWLHRAAERLRLLGAHVGAQRLGEILQHAGQDPRVGRRRLGGLAARLRLRERRQQLLVAGRDPPGRRPGPQRGQDAGLPVDQRVP